jgi:hypothetical protein
MRMDSIIVVPDGCAETRQQIRLAPGEVLTFGRSDGEGRPGGGAHLRIGHPGVSRQAGTVTAAYTHWSLTNFSATGTYVVENPEGAGEHIKVAPGRVEAPVPFEFSRVLLPARYETLSFDVWAPRHDYAPGGPAGEAPCTAYGERTVPAFPLDRSKRYFQVLAALCEPRLRGAPFAPTPTVSDVVRRLRPVWPTATAAAVQWNINYLAVKLRLRPENREDPAGCARLNGKKDTLVGLALRFGLLDEEDLAVLNRPVAGTSARTGR